MKKQGFFGKPVAPVVGFGVVLLVLLLLASLFYFVPSQIVPTTDDTDADVADWADWAEVAWRYFQPGVGVSFETGLHYARADWQRFTDWDLGVYISAIICAERLGIISREGSWGSDYRLERVLSFLETRAITSDGLPYAQYDANTGRVPDDLGNQAAHASDVANLLLSLDDLRSNRPDLSSRIESVVARYNFDFFAQSSYFAANDIYPFYAAQGYWAFGFSTPQLRDLADLGGGSTVDVYGEAIPQADITSEPLMLAVLSDRANDLYRTYADRVFSAQQKRYELTGTLTAFSEGAYLAPQYYIYEWIVTGTGESWVITAGGVVDVPEVVYTKIAFAFHVVYDNNYTQLLVDEVSSLATDNGFLDGILESGTVAVLSDKTNGMILQAACYAKFSKSSVVSLEPTAAAAAFPRYAVTTFVVAPERIEEQLQLLDVIGAYNVTIVIRESDHDLFQLVYNAALNYTGCIIPEFSFMQTMATEYREDVVDARFNEFMLADGSYPSGVFSFQLDTFTLNYLKDTFNTSFAVGNAWDQVNIDFVSLRGGFSTPYYASRRNSLVPAKTQKDSSVLVMSPLSIAPTDTYHFDNNHLIDLYNNGVGMVEFKYVSLNNPFFTPFFLELDWLVSEDNADLLGLFVENYKWVYETFDVLTAADFASAFESSFPTTPEYHFTYTSSDLSVFPATKGWTIEWLMNTDCRIARVGNNVVSALKYTFQAADPFLSSSKAINFTGSRFGEDPSNLICTDLSLSIDALWQFEYGNRTLTKTGYVVYDGKLEDFY